MLKFQINWTVVTAVVTAVVAVYGAILSTWNAVSRRLESSRRIRVEVSQGFPTYGANLGPACIVVTASNIGRIPVTLVHGGLLLPDNRQTFVREPIGDVQFPQELESGKSCRMFMESRELAGTITRASFTGKVKIVGFYRDAIGTTYKSKAFEFDVEDWLRHKE